MTLYYCRGAAAGLNNGSSWTNAYTSMATAAGAAVAGDTINLSDDGTTLGASQTFTGALTNMVKVICVNHLGSVPPASADLSTAGVIALGTTNNFTIKGCFYAYGITYRAGPSATTNFLLCQNNLDHEIFDFCTLELLNASASSCFFLGLSASSKAGLVELFSSNLKFAASGQSISMQGANLVWRGGAVQGTGPSTLFTDASSSTSCSAAFADVEGVDLSLITGTLVGDIPHPITFRFRNCKTGVGATPAATQSQPNGAVVYMQNSDSGSSNYRNEKWDTYRGVQTTESAVVLNAGMSDGTAAFSDKIVTTANCDRNTNFEAIPYEIWCDTPGVAKTVTVELLTDGVTLKDNEVWAFLDTLQASGSPLGTIARSISDPLAAGASLAAGSGASAWSTPGISSPVSQKISFTFTPQKKGLVTVTLCVGRASTTLYASGPTQLS